MTRIPALQFHPFHNRKGQNLVESFYRKDDVLEVAQSLLGKVLYSRVNGELTSGFIVETEAYRGADDKASHAYLNKRTSRTETMFAEGGVAYVYLCYGIHHLFNVVTGPENTANAVLVRAIEPYQGIDVINNRRSRDLTKSSTSGPGCLTAALGITKDFDRLSLLDQSEVVGILDMEIDLNAFEIVSSPRIGVDYAQECASWPWRFSLKDNLWVSGGR